MATKSRYGQYLKYKDSSYFRITKINRIRLKFNSLQTWPRLVICLNRIRVSQNFWVRKHQYIAGVGIRLLTQSICCLPKKSKSVPWLSPLVARRAGDFEVMECSLTIADRLWIGCMKIQECGCITPFRHKWIGMACSMQDSTPICRLIKCAGHIIYVKFKNISSADFVTKLERIIQWNFVTILILSTNVFA